MVPADNTAATREGFLQGLLSNWALTVLNGVVGFKMFVHDVTS